MALTPEEEKELAELEAKYQASHAPRVEPASPMPPRASPPATNALDRFQFSRLAGAAGMGAYGATGPAVAMPSAISRPPEEVTKAVAALGVRGVPPAVGQFIGAGTGPLAPGMVPALGALGGVVGEAGAQALEGRGFRPGAMVGAGVAGAVPGSPLANAGIKRLGLEAFKQGAGNVAGKAAETAIDARRLPTVKESLASTAAAMAGTGFAKFLDAGSNAQAAAEALKRAQDATRRETTKLGRELGYVLPPSVVRPNVANNTVNSIGGKAAMAHEAIRHNQPITNAAVREELGLPAEMPLDAKAMNTAKLVPMAAYKEFAGLTPQSGVALEQFKEASNKANVFRRAYRDTRDPDTLAKLREQEVAADDAFKTLSDEAKKAGKPELIEKFKDARVQLAKIGLIEEAINKGTGDVDATIIGKAFDAGEKLTGKLATIGRFQNAFSQMVKDQASAPAAGVNQLIPFAGIGVGGYMMKDNPALGVAAMAAGQVVPQAARRMALSPFYQNRFTDFAYGPTRQDVPAMLAQFGANATGRQVSDKKDGKATKADAALERARAAIEEAKAKAKQQASPPPVAPPAPPPEPPKQSFIEGKVYRDPNTGERRRYVNGAFQPV